MHTEFALEINEWFYFLSNLVKMKWAIWKQRCKRTRKKNGAERKTDTNWSQHNCTEIGVIYTRCRLYIVEIEKSIFIFSWLRKVMNYFIMQANRYSFCCEVSYMVYGV